MDNGATETDTDGSFVFDQTWSFEDRAGTYNYKIVYPGDEKIDYGYAEHILEKEVYKLDPWCDMKGTQVFCFDTSFDTDEDPTHVFKNEFAWPKYVILEENESEVVDIWSHLHYYWSPQAPVEGSEVKFYITDPKGNETLIGTDNTKADGRADMDYTFNTTYEEGVYQVRMVYEEEPSKGFKGTETIVDIHLHHAFDICAGDGTQIFCVDSGFEPE